MEYTVILHPAREGGYWAEVPALVGCFSQGENLEQTLANVREAIEAHLKGLKEEGQEFPAEGGLVFAKVEISAP